MTTEVLITKGDRTIVDSFADEQEEAEIRAAFAAATGRYAPAGSKEASDNKAAIDRILAWQMSLAAAHMDELDLPADFSDDDLAGITFNYEGAGSGS